MLAFWSQHVSLNEPVSKTTATVALAEVSQEDEAAWLGWDGWVSPTLKPGEPGRSDA